MADKKKLGRPISENPKNIQMRIRLTEKENRKDCRRIGRKRKEKQTEKINDHQTC